MKISSIPPQLGRADPSGPLRRYANGILQLLAALFLLASGAAFAQNPLISNISFTPPTIAPGDTAVMRVFLANNNGFPAIGVTVAGMLPNAPAGGVQVLGVAANTCGGTAAAAGLNGYSLTGGTIPAVIAGTAGTCYVDYNVTSYNFPGSVTYSETLVSTEVTGTVNGSPVTAGSDAVNSLSLLSIAPINGNKNFNPATVGVGETSTLTINIGNPNVFAMPGVSYTDNLPTGMTVLGAPVLSGSCGGATVSGPIGGSAITVSNATLGIGLVCTVTVSVAAPGVTGTAVNTIPVGAITSSVRGAGANNATAVTAALAVQNTLVVSKSFNSATVNIVGGVPPGDAVQLTITVTNPSPNALTAISVTDTLPLSATLLPALVTHDPAGPGGVVVSNTCGFTNGGTLTDGQPSLTLTGGALPAGPSSCSVVVWVRANSVVGSNEIATNRIPVGNVTALGGATGTTPIVNGNQAIATINVKNIAPGGGIDFPIEKYFVSDANQANQANGGVYFYNLTVIRPAAYATTPIVWVRIDLRNPHPFTDLTDVQLGDQLNLPNLFGLTLKADPATIAANTTVFEFPSNTGGCTGFGAPITTGTTATNVSLSFPGSAVKAAIVGRPLTRCMVQFPLYLDSTAPVATTVGTYQNRILSGAVSGSAPGVGPSGVPANNTAGSTQVALNVLADLSVAKQFNPAVVGPSGVSTLKITLANNDLNDQTGVSFADVLPAGVTLNGTGNPVYASCGASPVLTPSGASPVTLTFSGLTIPMASGSPLTSGKCVIDVEVMAPAVTGGYPNTIAANAVTSNQGLTNSAPSNTATLNVTALNITVAKSFDRATVRAGESARASIRVDNPNAGFGTTLTNVSFGDDLPPGMVLAPNPNVAVACVSGTGSAANVVANPAVNPEIAVTGLTIAPLGFCTVSFDVQLSVAGSRTNVLPIGAVTSAQGATNTGVSQATLAGIPSSSVQKSILPTTVAVGQPALVTIRVSNTTGAPVGPFNVLDQINPAAGYGATATIPGGYLVAPAATWDIDTSFPITVAPAGCVMTSASLVTAGVNDSASFNITVPATSFCDVQYRVIPSAVGQYRNAIPQANVTGGAQVCFNGEVPCFTSADLTVTAAGILQVNKAIAGVTAPNAVLANWTFTVSSSNCNLSNLTLAATTLNSGTVSFAGLPVYTDVTATTMCSYAVAESGGNANYALSGTMTGITLSAAPTVTTVTATNVRRLATMTINKTVSGNTTGFTTGGSFAFNLNCGVDGNFGPYNAVVSAGSLTGSALTGDLPAGASCTVTETAPTQAQAPANYNWGTTPAAVVVTVAANGTTQASFTNTLSRQLGSVVVSKTVNGVLAGLVANSTFDLIVSCSDNGTVVTGFPTTRSLMNGGSATITNVPVGASCTVTEPVLPATTNAGYAYNVTLPLAVTVIEANVGVTPVALPVTNTLIANAVALTVTKTLRGGPSTGYTGSFNFTASCTAATPNISVASNGAATGNSASTTVNVTAGTSCTVSETAPTQAQAPAGYKWGAAPAAQTVTVLAGIPALTFVNTLLPLDPPFITKAVRTIDQRTVEWTVTVINNAPANAGIAIAFTVSDVVPTNAFFLSGSLSCTPFAAGGGTTAGNTCAFDPVTKTITANGTLGYTASTDPLTAPERFVIVLRATIAPGVQVNNTACVSSPGMAARPCASIGVQSVAEAIPTIGQYALLCLGLLMAGLALFSLRRQRQL